MQHTEILVVGGGGSGLAAAIAAAEAGKTVVLLEKAPVLGGSTGWSIGSITAAGTLDQREAGILDSPQQHLADMPTWAGDQLHRDNMDMCGLLTQMAPGVIEWLRSIGVEFIGPFAEPPHSLPRMHNVLPNSKSFIYHLSKRASKVGVKVYTKLQAERLIQEGLYIVGVEARDDQDKLHVFHTKAVILASGDFNASPDFKVEFNAHEQISIPAVNTYATGDGHRMARQAGAIVLNGDIAFNDPRFRFAPPPVQPWLLSLPPIKPITRLMRWGFKNIPAKFIRHFLMKFVTTSLAPEVNLFKNGALLINKNGENFLHDGEKIGFGIARQPDGQAYALLDRNLIHQFSKWPNFISTAPSVAYAYIDDYIRNRPDLCTMSNNLKQLALIQKMHPDVLEKSAAAAGLIEGPFLLLGPIHAFTILADAGLAVSKRLEVIDKDNIPIPGLFAAGSTGQGGMLLKGHGHHLAWAFGSGRLAGSNAAEYVSHLTVSS